jgi:U3 small nucleolar RNA-associated protein 18
VDGKTNANLQTIYLKGFPIHTAHFIENGEQVILASQRRHFYCYDMVAGNVTRIPEIRGISVDTNLVLLENSLNSLR